MEDLAKEVEEATQKGEQSREMSIKSIEMSPYEIN